MSRFSRSASAGDELARERNRDAELSDEDITSRLQAGDMRVLGEFIFRFQGIVLGQARRYGIPAEDRRNWTLEILHDVALAIARGSVRPPHVLSAYLVRSAHHRWASQARSRAREQQRVRDAETDAGSLEAVCERASSSYTVRASRGPDWEEKPLSPAIQRLATTLVEGLTVDDRRLIGWVSRDVPHNEIASELGISRSAASQRVRRLRARLVESARRYADGLVAPDRDEINRFFRRAELPESRSLTVLLGQSGGPSDANSATSRREG
jgi:DNA-directed RNA polymerase specialized sigma24 family protein